MKRLPSSPKRRKPMKNNNQIVGQISIFEYLLEKSNEENTIINTKTVAQASPAMDKSKRGVEKMKNYTCHKVSDEEMQPIIDRYNAIMANDTKKTRDEYAEFIITKLSGLIQSRINQKVKADLINYMDREDIASQAQTYILENLYKYDPRRSSPSSYFTPWIDQAIREHISDEKSAYYIRRRREYDKRLAEIGYADGLDNARITDDIAAKLLGEKASTIRRTKEITSGYKVSLDGITEERSDKTDALNSESSAKTNEFHKSPEEMYLINEQQKYDNKLLNDLLSMLTPYEKYIFIMKNTEKPEKPTTYKRRKPLNAVRKYYSLKDISTRLEEDEELLKKFNLKKRPCPATIRQDLINIKIKLSYKVKMYEGYDNYSDKVFLKETAISYMETVAAN